MGRGREARGRGGGGFSKGRVGEGGSGGGWEGSVDRLAGVWGVTYGLIGVGGEEVGDSGGSESSRVIEGSEGEIAFVRKFVFSRKDGLECLEKHRRRDFDCKNISLL